MWWGEVAVDVDADAEPRSRRYGGVFAKPSLKCRRAPHSTTIFLIARADKKRLTTTGRATVSNERLRLIVALTETAG